MKKERIILLGSGAIGTIYAERLCKSEHYFAVATDSERFERYNKEGVYFCGKKLNLNFIIPEKNQPPADIILVAVKSYSLCSALETISPIVSDKTIIVSLMNGITSEITIAKRFQNSQVLYGFYIGHTATRKGNDTWQDGNYMTIIGDYPSSSKEPSATTMHVVNILSSAGIKIEAKRDMKIELWKKYAVNICLNQTTAFFNCNYGEIIGEKRKFFDSLADEIQQVAIAEKIHGAEAFSKYVKDVLGMMSPTDRSSMAQDVLAGRRTEVEEFAGEVIRMAEKHGINVPANRAVYSSVK